MGPVSLQPEAPQAPGHVLYGRFGNLGKNRMAWVFVAAIALLVIIWYFRKRGA